MNTFFINAKEQIFLEHEQFIRAIICRTCSHISNARANTMVELDCIDVMQEIKTKVERDCREVKKMVELT